MIPPMSKTVAKYDAFSGPYEATNNTKPHMKVTQAKNNGMN